MRERESRLRSAMTPEAASYLNEFLSQPDGVSEAIDQSFLAAHWWITATSSL